MSWYRFSFQFNKSYAFRQEPELTDNQRLHQEIVSDMSGAVLPQYKRCISCNRLLNKWNERLTELVINSRRFDLSKTYDGVLIASAKFKKAFEDAGLCGLTFEDVPRETSFFWAKAIRAVPFDTQRRGTEFVKQCSECGTFESVVGATPVYLLPGASIKDDEVVQTDIEFGTDDEMSPKFLCGEGVKKKLEAAKLRGVDCYPLES